ncbi:MAG: RagB/SusD family nutrient uptake outer membrane protein [Candidatus Cryptobacteroides sp.]
MKKIILTVLATSLLATSCLSQLDQYPHTKTNADQVYSTPEGYISALAKLYASFVIVGQEQGGGDPDLSSNEGYDFLRGYFNLQEGPTEEMAPTWLSGDDMTDLAYMTWDAANPWVADVYYRLYYNIALCNDFLRHSKSSGDESIAALGEEARFLRALAYWYVLDLFGQGPFVDETMGVGAFVPEAYTNVQLFEFIESELLDITLPSRTQVVYGRASQAAAQTLLARLYLNAEVYGAGPHYSECINCCNEVIKDGYSLESDYSKLFNADNNLRTNEIIFPFVVDASNTVSWGATTYIVCGQLGNDNAQDGALFGVDSKWGMFRARGEFSALFGDCSTSSDSRCLLFSQDQEQYLDKGIDDQSNGYFGEKWSNLFDNGDIASSVAAVGCSIDFPVFRLAEVYLMAAEAMLRGGSGISSADALAHINELQERAFGDTAHNLSESELTLDFILDERSRELYWECVRRTDLIRYGKFTTDAKIWQWKGGVKDGQATDSKYNVYPIPEAELSANPNLKNLNY